MSAVAQAPVTAASPPAEVTLTVEELVSLELQEDRARRLRVSARVDGRGPFPFLVDTGADHSVLSVELARALKLPSAGVARVNGIAGSAIAPRAAVGRLEAGGRKLERFPAALLPREYLGALGLIGLDLLAGQRVDIDFPRRRMDLRRSRGFGAAEPGEIVVRGKSRFGKLILVDSTVRREPVYVVLDTGAQDSIGNAALRGLIARRRRAAIAKPVELRSVTGQTLEGELDELAELTLGGVLLRGIPVVYAELHTFRIYKLAAEPALMLGMNTLRSFDKVRVDFGRREVGFQLPATLAPGFS